MDGGIVRMETCEKRPADYGLSGETLCKVYERFAEITQNLGAEPLGFAPFCSQLTILHWCGILTT